MRFLALACLAFLALSVHAASERHVNSDTMKRLILRTLGTKEDISEILRKGMEKFRSIMKEGDPKLGLPPMDPYVMDHREIDLNIDILTGKASVDNIAVGGLSTYTYNSVSGSDDPLEANFDVSIPVVTLDASAYELDVMVANEYHIFGQGTMNIVTTGMRLVGHAKGQIDENTYLKVTSIDLTITIETLKSNIQGLMGNPTDGELANEIIEEFGPGIVQDYGNKIGNYFGDIVRGIINKKIENLTLDEILDLINS